MLLQEIQPPPLVTPSTSCPMVCWAGSGETSPCPTDPSVVEGGMFLMACGFYLPKYIKQTLGTSNSWPMDAAGESAPPEQMLSPRMFPAQDGGWRNSSSHQTLPVCTVWGRASSLALGCIRPRHENLVLAMCSGVSPAPRVLCSPPRCLYCSVGPQGAFLSRGCPQPPARCPRERDSESPRLPSPPCL